MRNTYPKQMALVFLLLATSAMIGCSKNSTGGDVDDGNTPYFISDLNITAATDSTILLVWTATGDDSDQGTASSYDIRHWHTWISPSNWDSAVKLTGEPHPRPAGQKDSMLIRGLTKDSTYYFGLVVCDEANNCAGSNCAKGVCFTDAVVVFPDPHLDSVVRAMIPKPTGDILRSDLMLHQILNANQAGISSLSGIECWTTLDGIMLAGDSVTDLTPLSGLTRLTGLGLTGNGISNIAPLNGLVNLELLHLRANQVTDLTALTGMVKLHQLDITQNSITDLAPLVANSGLATNDTIFLQYNPLSQTAINVQAPALQARGVTIIGL